ncbi:heavy metal translocating P-type ATPase [Ahrensia kielensis]|uniref:Heavy metal translocating P-type ATPase n=1 Tax=Ahrensia kielensis TaxID=76980 RepID=A0ABU9T2A9_9HYPH
MCNMCGGLAEYVVDESVERQNAKHYVLSVPNMSCGACISKIENSMRSLEGVYNARANLTLKRLIVETDETVDCQKLIDLLQENSFTAFRIEENDRTESEEDTRSKRLLRALAVAGFGAANIMLLSVSAWSGATDATRDLFHLISAVIAVPVVAYAGQPFFRSALGALRAGHVNMDVPISLAVLLALGMSIFQTLTSKPEAYFDAAAMLLFFLLIGRYLDQRMRSRAKSSVISLGKYATREAVEVLPSGETRLVAVSDIIKKMRLRIFAGARFPVDCKIVSGFSDVDRSMVTGESEAVALSPNMQIEAGALNLTGVLDVEAIEVADKSFLAEITRMLDAAEHGKGNYVRIADRMARIYTPAVHAFAFLAFTGWMITTHGDWEHSLLVAIAVLIVTCPCALGLAVPVAHVVAASRLVRNGILMRDGSALERLAEADFAVFDKTGTLTDGIKMVIGSDGMGAEEKPIIASLANCSTHPSAKGISDYLKGSGSVLLSDIEELPGKGIKAIWNGKEIRLGQMEWVLEITNRQNLNEAEKSTAFAIQGGNLVTFDYRENVRPSAYQTIKDLRSLGIGSTLLSGDTQATVERIARDMPLEQALSEHTPQAKLKFLEGLHAQSGLKTIMVGDGINDAPALAAAHVSFAPSSATDIGRQAADFILTRDDLSAITFARNIAVRTNRVVRQNFALALVYNCIAVPLAILGFVTPLIAAIAMSLSSIIVISNSLRLLRGENMIIDKQTVTATTHSPTEKLAA